MLRTNSSDSDYAERFFDQSDREDELAERKYERLRDQESEEIEENNLGGFTFKLSLSKWLGHWALEVKYKGIDYAAEKLAFERENFFEVLGIEKFEESQELELMEKYVRLQADRFTDEKGNKLSDNLN